MMISSTVAAAAVVGLRNLFDLAMKTNHQQRRCCWYYRTVPVAFQCFLLLPLLEIAAFALASDCPELPVVVVVAVAVQQRWNLEPSFGYYSQWRCLCLVLQAIHHHPRRPTWRTFLLRL